jgi:hypothetical protein
MIIIASKPLINWWTFATFCPIEALPQIHKTCFVKPDHKITPAYLSAILAFGILIVSPKYPTENISANVSEIRQFCRFSVAKLH